MSLERFIFDLSRQFFLFVFALRAHPSLARGCVNPSLAISLGELGLTAQKPNQHFPPRPSTSSRIATLPLNGLSWEFFFSKVPKISADKC